MSQRNDQVLYQVSESSYAGGTTRGGVPMNDRQLLQRNHLATSAEALVTNVAPGPWTPEQVRGLISRLLDATGIDYDQRVEVLSGTLVSEAVRPHWEAGLTADEAHDRLCRNDPELAEVVEMVSTVLLARVEAQDEARAMIGFLEAEILSPAPSL